MDYASLDLAYKIMGGMSMAATLVVAATALVVAVVLSIRRRSMAAAWILVVAWGGSLLVDIGYMITPILLTDRLGYMVVRWSFVGLGVVNLFFGLLACVAFALFRPRPKEASNV